jgi:hypothetical protein
MAIENDESQLVGLFMQLWGRRDVQSTEPATILNNAQNQFDNWFGDICGEVRFRYFFIEFKKTRAGFLAEIRAGSKKPHRTALYEHLRNDTDCRNIAWHGHFAAYADEGTGKLVFEPYAHSPAPVNSKAEIVGKEINSTLPWHGLDYRSWCLSFPKLYEALHDEDISLHNQTPPWLFNKGLGIPEADLEQYVQCMYHHLQYFEQEDGLMVLGAVNPKTNELKVVSSTPFRMVQELKKKFEALRNRMAAELGEDADRK